VEAILASGWYTGDEPLNLAADHDPGFDQSRFAEALAAIDRLPDSLFSPYDLSPEDTSALRAIITQILSSPIRHLQAPVSAEIRG
jgi:hypothetical protein